MQMTLNVHEHDVLEHVAFINTDNRLFCIGPAYACLINADFLVLSGTF